MNIPPGLLCRPLAMLLNVSGQPVAYSVSRDDTMTIMLLVACCGVMALVGYYRRFLARQIRVFFYGRHTTTTDGETFEERYFLLALCLNASLMLAFATFFYVISPDATTMGRLAWSPPLVVAFFVAVYVTYFLIKAGLYTVVNLTFFGSKKSLQWLNAYLLIISFEGLLMIPLVVVQVYGGLPFRYALFGYSLVLLFVKILSIYKCLRIFSQANGDYVQIFLYLCTLEIVPLLAMGGFLQLVTDEMIIIF